MHTRKHAVPIRRMTFFKWQLLLLGLRPQSKSRTLTRLITRILIHNHGLVVLYLFSKLIIDHVSKIDYVPLIFEKNISEIRWIRGIIARYFFPNQEYIQFWIELFHKIITAFQRIYFKNFQNEDFQNTL